MGDDDLATLEQKRLRRREYDVRRSVPDDDVIRVKPWSQGVRQFAAQVAYFHTRIPVHVKRGLPDSLNRFGRWAKCVFVRTQLDDFFHS